MQALSAFLLILTLGCTSGPDAGRFAHVESKLRPESRRNSPIAFDAAPLQTTDSFVGVSAMIVTGSGSESDADISSLAYYAPNLETASTGTASTSEGGENSIPREVIYTADLSVVVVSIEQSTRAVQSLAEKIGRYLQQSDSTSITVRVPAPKFESTIEQIATLGEVVDRSIVASDVTEEVLDLNIRLDNANRTRARLIEHLAHSKKIGDTLKIEGKLRSMRSPRSR